jgi:5'-nucleotidase
MSPSRPLRAARWLIAAAAALLSACGGDDGAPLTITVLHVNDHHSRLDEETVTLTLPDASGATRSVTVPMGGFARVAAAIAEESARSPNPIRLHAGDAITGDLYYTQSAGEADAVAMNTVCFDAMALGNHEFDNGDAGLATFVGHLHRNPAQCRTPVLSANMSTAAASPMAGRYSPYTVVRREGQSVGIVGLTVAGKTKNASRPDAGTQFGDEVAAAQKAIDELRSQGVERIILLSHVGYDAEVSRLAPQLDGVDVIVGGDSHTLLGPDSLKAVGLSPQAPYPARVTDKRGKPVCVVQAWQYSYAVGKLTVSFDRKGDVTACDGQPMVLLGNTYRIGNAAASAADAAAFARAIGAQPALRPTTPLAATVTALEPYAKAKVALGTQVIGRASENLCLRRVPGVGPRSDVTRSSLGDACNKNPEVIAHGGQIQQLVAQAFLEQGQRFGGADIALQNGGGVRIDVPAGDITVGTVYTLLPFKNLLVRVTMTGQQVKDTLEDAVDSMLGGAGGTGSGAYPYTAGLRFEVDITRAKGSRVGNLQLLRNGSWVAFDLAATYRVIANDFTAAGGDNYLTLRNIPKSLKEDTFLDYADSFLQYVRGRTSISRPALETYSTQRYTE